MTDLAERARVLPFQRIHNFRDYGGYATADGGRLRMGRLYRSAQHHGASADDLARVAALGLRAVIDLRGGGERRAAPCPRPDDFTAELIFVEENTAGLAPHVAAAATGVPDAAAAHAGMVRGYAAMPFRPRLVPILTRYFEALARVDGPTLIHCMAGKDRTGLAVALAQASLGVAWDDILADYLLTNTAGQAEARIAEGARHIRASRDGPVDEAAVRVLMMVEPAYLSAAFDAIRARHGSIDAYLAEVLGITPEQGAAMRARLVEQAA